MFTAAKVAGLLKKVVGDPVHVSPEDDFPTSRSATAPIATLTLDTADLLHDADELHDENSVIFRSPS